MAKIVTIGDFIIYLVDYIAHEKELNGKHIVDYDMINNAVGAFESINDCEIDVI